MQFLARSIIVVALYVFPATTYAESPGRQFVDAFRADCFDFSNDFERIKERMWDRGAKELESNSNIQLPEGLNLIETVSWFVDDNNAPQYLMALSHAEEPSGESELLICGFSTPIAVEDNIILDLIEVFQLTMPDLVEEIDGKRIQQWSLTSNGEPVLLRLSDNSPSFERGLMLSVLAFKRN